MECGAAIPDIELLMQLSEIYGISVNDIIKADISKIKYQKEIVFPEKDKKAKNIFVIGCGRWGTFLAWYLDRIGHTVSLYGRITSENMQRLMKNRKNEHLSIPESIVLTSDLESVRGVDIIVISASAQSLQSVADSLRNLQIENKILVLCMKGIEIETGRRLSQVMSDTVAHSNKIAVWLGPGHVQEFYCGVPNCVVIDSNDEFVKDDLIRSFSSELIRFYYALI